MDASIYHSLYLLQIIQHIKNERKYNDPYMRSHCVYEQAIHVIFILPPPLWMKTSLLVKAKLLPHKDYYKYLHCCEYKMTAYHPRQTFSLETYSGLDISDKSIISSSLTKSVLLVFIRKALGYKRVSYSIIIVSFGSEK